MDGNLIIIGIIAAISLVTGIVLGVNHERRQWNKVGMLGQKAPPWRFRSYL